MAAQALTAPVAPIAPYVVLACVAAVQELRTYDADAIAAWVADVLPPTVRREIDAGPGLRAFVAAVLAQDDDPTEEVSRGERRVQ